MKLLCSIVLQGDAVPTENQGRNEQAIRRCKVSGCNIMMVKQSVCLKLEMECSPRGDKEMSYEDMRMDCNEKVQVKGRADL